MLYLCQSLSQPATLLPELAVFSLRDLLLLCSRNFPCFPAPPDYFASQPWQPLKGLWMEVSLCHLLPLKHSQVFNTSAVWGETKCREWHLWRGEDFHGVTSPVQWNGRAGMLQWLISLHSWGGLPELQLGPPANKTFGCLSHAKKGLKSSKNPALCKLSLKPEHLLLCLFFKGYKCFTLQYSNVIFLIFFPNFF